MPYALCGYGSRECNENSIGTDRSAFFYIYTVTGIRRGMLYVFCGIQCLVRLVLLLKVWPSSLHMTRVPVLLLHGQKVPRLSDNVVDRSHIGDIHGPAHPADNRVPLALTTVGTIATIVYAAERTRVYVTTGTCNHVRTCAIWKACSRSTSPSSGDCPR